MATSLRFYHLHLFLRSPGSGVNYYISLLLFLSFSKKFCLYVLGEKLDNMHLKLSTLRKAKQIHPTMYSSAFRYYSDYCP